MPEVRFYCAPELAERELMAWSELAGSVSWAHYRQDPAWAAAQAASQPDGPRRPHYFWAERSGRVCLTGVGVRRRLPLLRREFLEFPKGPTFSDPEAFDAWLVWIASALDGAVARLRVAPPVPLRAGGDDVETLLEKRGFRRRRILGSWATLLVDIAPGEEAILAAFRPATRRLIRKSQRLGIEVHEEDSSQGWSALAELQADLAEHAPIEAATVGDLAAISRHWLREGAGGTVLVARLDGEPLAAALLVTHRGIAHLPLMPSSRRHRELPATHLLVWEAARWARSHRCSTLDLSGYSLVAEPGDPLWGINQFKRGFASIEEVARSVAIHERAPAPLVAVSAAAVRHLQERRRADKPTPPGAGGQPPPA